MADTACMPSSGFERPDIDTLELTRVLHALSDPVRLGIVKRLADAGAMNCRLAGGPDVPKATLSRHFKALRAAGIVETSKDPSGVYHSRLRTACLEARFPGLLGAVLASAEAV